jgi:hypothetical protein
VVIYRWRRKASIFVFGVEPGWSGNASNARSRFSIRIVGFASIVVADLGSEEFMTDENNAW